MTRSIHMLVVLMAASLLATAATGQQPGSGSDSAPRNSSWREIVTPDFIVTGNAPTAALRRTLVELTRFRDSLARLFPQAALTSPVPTYVVVLRDFNTFRRFQPRDSRGKVKENVGGYFSRRADANVIVLPAPSGNGTLETIFHEYTHYFFSRNVHTPIPTWLNEGLADFYSTFRGDYRGKTLVGDVPPDRLALLRNSTFVPLRDIVSPRDLESMWRWQRQVAMFYAESWALVHYIVLGREHPTSAPLSTYLASLAEGADQDRAFRAAFGTDVDGMDRELRDYVRRFSLNAMVYDMQTEKQSAGEIRPISEVDVNALEGRLLLEVWALADAEKELKQAVQQQPTHAAAQIALARLRLAQDREDEATAALQQVVAANGADAAAQYYLGVSLERAWRHERQVDDADD